MFAFRKHLETSCILCIEYWLYFQLEVMTIFMVARGSPSLPPVGWHGHSQSGRRGDSRGHLVQLYNIGPPCGLQYK